jgi:hypothetical protein
MGVALLPKASKARLMKAKAVGNIIPVEAVYINCMQPNGTNLHMPGGEITKDMD